MRTSAVLQIFLAGTAFAAPHREGAPHKRAEAAVTNVFASAVGTGQAFATVSKVYAGAVSAGKAISGRDTEPTRPMPAEYLPAPNKVAKRQTPGTTVIASAGGFATASATPEHVKVDGGGNGKAVAVQISGRDIEIENELPVPHRVEERQIKSITLSIEAAATATASVSPKSSLSKGIGSATGKSSTSGGSRRRMVEVPDLEGVRRTEGGALSMALMNDVDLDLFKETVDTVKGYADNLQEVVRTYSEKAEAAENLEEATKAIDTKQLTADIAAPMSQLNDALYTGVSRMMMSSISRPRRQGWDGLANAAGAYDLTAQLIAIIVVVLQLVAGLSGGLGGGAGGAGGLNILSALLSGLLGGSTGLLSGGTGGLVGGTSGLVGGDGLDTVTNLINGLLGITNAFVPIDNVTTNLTPVIGI